MNQLFTMILTLLGFVGGVAVLFLVLFWLFGKIPKLNIGVPGDHGDGFDPNKK